MSDLFFRAIKAQKQAKHLMSPKTTRSSNRQFHRALTDEQIGIVLKLWRGGMRKVAIAQATALNQSTVYNVINRYEIADGQVKKIKRDPYEH